MELPSSGNLRQYSVALFRFNRTTPIRYFSIDLVIFGFPLVAAAPSKLGPDAVLAVVSMLAARCGGLTIDDYFDREADAVESTERPIPAGLVSPSEALGLGIVLLAVGLATAALVNARFLVAEFVAYAGLFVSFGVVNDLDVPVLPTLATVTSVSMLTVMGWLTYGAVSSALVVAFLATWCWDVAHDSLGAYLDREGDAAAGIQTVGVALSRAHVAALTVVSLVASFALLTALLGSLRLAVVPAVLLAGVAARVVSFYRGSQSGATARTAVEWYVVGAYAWSAFALLGRGGGA